MGRMITQDVKYSKSKAVELYLKQMKDNISGKEQKRRLLKNTLKDRFLNTLTEPAPFGPKYDNLVKLFAYGSRKGGTQKKEICTTSIANKLWSLGLSEFINGREDFNPHLQKAMGDIGEILESTRTDSQKSLAIDGVADRLTELFYKEVPLDQAPFDQNPNGMLSDRFFNTLRSYGEKVDPATPVKPCKEIKKEGI